MSIFKACDIRGIYPDELKEKTAYLIGRAVGTLTKRAGGEDIVVGGDIRHSTPALHKSAIQGLIETGLKVYDVGILPTPALYFAKDYLHTFSCLMVTASHNPPQFNGFKFMIDVHPPTSQDVQSLRRIIEEANFVNGQGAQERVDSIIEEYQSFILSFANHTKKFKIVVDAAGGCMSQIAPEILSKLGQEVIPLFCQINPALSFRHPNPCVIGALRSLQERVLQEGADLGIGFDADGDRVVFVDEKGQIAPPDKIIVIFSRWLLQHNPGGKIVYDIKCSQIVPEMIKKYGGIPIMERSGHAFLKRRLIEEAALFAGELSGHLFFGDIQRDDSLIGVLRLLQILSEEDQPLSTLLDEIPHYITTPDIRIHWDGELEEVITCLTHSLSKRQIPFVTIDGVRAEFDGGWALARPSVTEPLITLRFEAKDEQALKGIVQEFLCDIPELKEAVECQLKL